MVWRPKNSVVVPIDFSGESKLAIDAALEFVEDRSHIHAVHVMFPLDVVAPGVVWGGMDEEGREKAVHEQCEKFIEEHGFDGITIAMRTGDPGMEIAEYAKTENADLIVIPSHGYHGFKRILLGSVAERVIRHADCAVLVLRRADAE